MDGKKSLLIDMDPQGHSAKILGVTQGGRKTILDLLIRRGDIRDFVRYTRIGNLWMIPSDWSLADFTVNVANDSTRHLKLKMFLDGVLDYDFIFIDPPPSLELITVNVLLASDYVIIPVPLTYLGLVGCASTLKVLSNTKKAFGYAPHLLFVVPNIYEEGGVSEKLLEILRGKLGDMVSQTVIRKDIQIDRAQSFALTVLEMSPQSYGTEDFKKLYSEIIAKIGER
jgi:chromosome partitioning protein